MTTNEYNTDNDDFLREVEQVRHLLGMPGNVLAYTEEFPSATESGVTARLRYKATYDPTGTTVVDTEWTGMTHDRKDEQ